MTTKKSKSLTITVTLDERDLDLIDQNDPHEILNKLKPAIEAAKQKLEADRTMTTKKVMKPPINCPVKPQPPTCPCSFRSMVLKVCNLDKGES